MPGYADLRASVPKFLLQGHAPFPTSDAVHVGRRPARRRVQNWRQRRSRPLLFGSQN